MDSTKIWLDKIQHTCRQFDQGYIDIIVDQCEISVIPALSGFSPEITWCSLYEGLPEDIYREQAPLLIRIDLADQQQVLWLYELAREVSLKAPLLVVVSCWPFSDLADWLRRCIDASHEGRPGVFRFWDTRVFPELFTDILDEAGKAQLKRPALFWSWMDRDRRPAMLEGNGAVTSKETCQKIDFSDAQFEAFMCLCDAENFLSTQSLPAHIFATKEAAFSACFNAMQTATKKRILFEEERDTWVMEHLCKHQKEEVIH
ncbi:DUF4123 domain-containing protein [Cedecea sp. FDAARGOS_727]|uniref:DUF4123 domain-containing protein n=1 Tax=Cedecea sp. FDAARGOS_727 TaxID=2545798 RepID=UPI00143E2047|nr:DUF4123 domain-containing protein [Cedecea sp. FDAARGOS_727]QIX97560.1 DUF4123 domain-containing protein [Cedecea sp. FDAARGOS_727]